MTAPGLLGLAVRWDLRADPDLGALAEELAAAGEDRLPGELRCDDGRLRLALPRVPLGVRGIWSSLRTLERARGVLRARLTPAAAADEATEIHVEVVGVAPDLDRLLDVACAAAPALLLLVGDHGDRPLELDAAGAAIRLVVPGPPPADTLAPILGIVLALLRRGSEGLLHHPALYSVGAPGEPLLIGQRAAGGHRVLGEGRMTQINAETTDGRRVCLPAQQSLTAVALHAEEEIGALLPADEQEPMRLRILGELPLRVDDAPEPVRPASVSVGRDRRPPVLVLLESGPTIRRDVGRLGRMLSDDPRVEVLIASWPRLDFTADAVLVGGKVWRPTQGAPQPERLDLPVRVDSVFYYATNDERPLGLDDAETGALRRLGARGMLPSHLDRICVVAELLEECARRGVPNNTPATQGCFSAKDQLEHMCRGYMRETGRVLARPETFVAAKAQVPTVLGRFARRRRECILKPTRGSRAEHIQIVMPGAEWPPNDRAGPFVLQRLGPRPLLVDGRKMDLRTYLFVDVDCEQLSHGSDLVFVRRASVAYERGTEAAEITNTSYSERLGLAPDIERLEDTPLDPVVRRQIRDRLEALMDELVRMHFWWARRRATITGKPLVANRVMMWGIDVLVCAGDDGSPDLLLLEANVYPQLYRKSPTANGFTEAMFRDEYLPLLLGARTRIAGERVGSAEVVPEAS